MPEAAEAEEQTNSKDVIAALRQEESMLIAQFNAVKKFTGEAAESTRKLVSEQLRGVQSRIRQEKPAPARLKELQRQETNLIKVKDKAGELMESKRAQATQAVAELNDAKAA